MYYTTVPICPTLVDLGLVVTEDVCYQWMGPVANKGGRRYQFPTGALVEDSFFTYFELMISMASPMLSTGTTGIIGPNISLSIIEVPLGVAG